MNSQILCEPSKSTRCSIKLAMLGEVELQIYVLLDVTLTAVYIHYCAYGLNFARRAQRFVRVCDW